MYEPPSADNTNSVNELQRPNMVDPDVTTENTGNIIADAPTAQAQSPAFPEPNLSSTLPARTASQDSANDVTNGSPAQTLSPALAAPDHWTPDDPLTSPDVFVPRRGTRIRRPPAYLRDYVTHFGEEEEEEEAATPGS
jgi:hypothetical protein